MWGWENEKLNQLFTNYWPKIWLHVYEFWDIRGDSMLNLLKCFATPPPSAKKNNRKEIWLIYLPKLGLKGVIHLPEGWFTAHAKYHIHRVPPGFSVFDRKCLKIIIYLWCNFSISLKILQIARSNNWNWIADATPGVILTTTTHTAWNHYDIYCVRFTSQFHPKC